MLPSKILVVDDSPEDRAIIRRHLLKDNPHGFQIMEAETGVDGWETLKSSTPDCILLDFNLPDFEGIQFLESLLKAKGVWAPPVVLLTGQGNEALAVQAMKCGAQDYFPKENLEPQVLQHSIQRAITRAESLREVETPSRDIGTIPQRASTTDRSAGEGFNADVCINTQLDLLVSLNGEPRWGNHLKAPFNENEGLCPNHDIFSPRSYRLYEYGQGDIVHKKTR